MKNYDAYVWRNLSRGVRRQELGVGFVAEKRIRLAKRLDTMRERLDGEGEKGTEKEKEKEKETNRDKQTDRQTDR